jgi:hypothetical protein
MATEIVADAELLLAQSAMGSSKRFPILDCSDAFNAISKTSLGVRPELRALLIAASSAAEIAKAIALLREAHPEAFHTQETLASRVFFDQPVHDFPYRGFIRPAFRRLQLGGKS